jgi:hypothetical protein
MGRSNLLATGPHASMSFSWNAPLQRSRASSQSYRADAMDPELRRRIEERASALWEADGRPDGRALDHWLQAEQEIVTRSMAGEEDPLAGIDQVTS